MTTQPSLPTSRPPLPVTVLSGFAGAGKTTLLTQLLRDRPGQRTAVISSDEPLIPAACPAAPEGCCTRTSEKVIHLAIAAGHYALRADLLLEAGRVARTNAFDSLLVENPGRALLEPVARTFSLSYPAYGLDLPQRTRLAGLATAVDASCFLRDFHTPPALLPEADAPDTPPLVSAYVLVEQVEHANVLVITKADLVSLEEVGQLRTLLRHLNPQARLVQTLGGLLPPAEQLAAGTPHQRATPAAHGISTNHFRDERPFHPERLWAFVRDGWPAALLRSQGLFWLASRPDEVMHWQQAGPSRQAKPVGTWWAAVPDRNRDPGYQRDARALRARWHPQFQDRVNTLRFIGEKLNEAQLRAALQSCLCTPLEIGRWRRGASFSDPWPRP